MLNSTTPERFLESTRLQQLRKVTFFISLRLGFVVFFFYYLKEGVPGQNSASVSVVIFEL